MSKIFYELVGIRTILKFRLKNCFFKGVFGKNFESFWNSYFLELEMCFICVFFRTWNVFHLLKSTEENRVVAPFVSARALCC